MNDFLIAYKSHIIYVFIVLASWLVLRRLTTVVHTWLLAKERERYPGETPTTINAIRNILNALWFVLVILSISFFFVGEDQYATLTSNFRMVIYLGLLAIGTIVAAATVNMWFKSEIAKRIELGYDPTSLKFLKSLVFYGIYGLGIILGLMAFPSMRGVANTALGGAGVLALVIGVASQEALANLVGGVFIITFKPFRVGDVVKVSETMVGTVADITLRHTVIRNFENKMIVIPNAIMNKEKIINYNLGDVKCCEHIEIGISYDSNVELAKTILQEEAQNHPLIYDNRTDIEIADGMTIVKVALIRLGDSSVTIRAWAWARSYADTFSMKCDVLTSVKARYEAEGIEIPYPYRTLVFKNDSQETSDSKLEKNRDHNISTNTPEPKQ